ncbi:uncharacterized protein METZ01_LOCUS345271, partial [marine metagenome]
EKFYEDGQYWEVVEGGTTKMDILNEAVVKMLHTFSEEEKMDSEIIVSIITFGDTADLFISPTKASEIEWTDMVAKGETALGEALKRTKEMIEDKKITLSRAYRPTIVLVSDGKPTDDWEDPMDDFINTGRSKKCDRMAMAIGKDADENVLKRFIEGSEHELFYANNAGQLYEFFRYVTMSVTTRSQSQNPNEIPADSDLKSKVSDESNLTTENSDESAQSNGDTSDDGEW